MAQKPKTSLKTQVKPSTETTPRIDADGALSLPGRLRAIWDDVRMPFAWLFVAFSVLGATVAIAVSPAGADRMAELPRALAAAMGQAHTVARLDPRPMEDEIARVRDEARRLAAERARLELRVVQLERGLDEVTGTVQRREALLARPMEETTASLPRRADTVVPIDPPPVMPRLDAARSETPRAETARAEPVTTGSVTLATRSQFGVELGSETTLTGLKGRWQRLSERHNQWLSRMEPLVSVRDGANGMPVLHLVAGPIADVAEAAALCARLRGAGTTACQPAPYDGQRLAPR